MLKSNGIDGNRDHKPRETRDLLAPLRGVLFKGRSQAQETARGKTWAGAPRWCGVRITKGLWGGGSRTRKHLHGLVRWKGRES